MKDLERMFDEAIEIVSECIDGVEIRPIKRPLTINRRAKSRWGCCKFKPLADVCEIEISERILSDEVPNDATMGTIIHEILHACRGCKGHQGQWRRYADAINRKYPQYNITRTTNAEHFGLETSQKANKKYAVKCVDCGHIYYRTKLTAVVKNPERYRCKCGGKLKRIDVRDIEVEAPTPSVSGQLCLLDI